MKAGFVLIEVMVSVAILNIGLLTAFAGIRSAQSILERAANTQEATFILDELMSSLAVNPPPVDSGGRTLRLAEYQWTVEVTSIDAAEEKQPEMDLRKLHVTVSWRKHGHTRSVEAYQLVEVGR